MAQEPKCSFCKRTRSQLSKDELMVQSPDGFTFICHACIAEAQALCANGMRENNWDTRVKLRQVPL